VKIGLAKLKLWAVRQWNTNTRSTCPAFNTEEGQLAASLILQIAGGVCLSLKKFLLQVLN
jgi:hypothetical protein